MARDKKQNTTKSEREEARGHDPFAPPSGDNEVEQETELDDVL